MLLTPRQRARIHQLLRETRSPTQTRNRLQWAEKPSLRWLALEAARQKIKLVKPGRKRGQVVESKRWSLTRGEVYRLLDKGLKVPEIAVALEKSEAIVRKYKREWST